MTKTGKGLQKRNSSTNAALKLPDELLILVATYLSAADRIRAAQVNHNWRRALHGQPTLWTDVWVQCRKTGEACKGAEQQLESARLARVWQFYEDRLGYILKRNGKLREIDDSDDDEGSESQWITEPENEASPNVPLLPQPGALPIPADDAQSYLTDPINLTGGSENAQHYAQTVGSPTGAIPDTATDGDPATPVAVNDETDIVSDSVEGETSANLAASPAAEDSGVQVYVPLSDASIMDSQYNSSSPPPKRRILSVEFNNVQHCDQHTVLQWPAKQFLTERLPLHLLGSLALNGIDSLALEKLLWTLSGAVTGSRRPPLQVLRCQVRFFEDEDQDFDASVLSQFPGLRVICLTSTRNRPKPKLCTKCPLWSKLSSQVGDEEVGGGEHTSLYSLHIEHSCRVLGHSYDEMDESEERYIVSPKRLQHLRYLHIGDKHSPASLFDCELPLINLETLVLNACQFLLGKLPPDTTPFLEGMTDPDLLEDARLTLLLMAPLDLPELKTLELRSNHAQSSAGPISPTSILCRLSAPQLTRLAITNGEKSYLTSNFVQELESWPRFCQAHSNLRMLVVCNTEIPELVTSLRHLPNLEILVFKEVALQGKIFRYLECLRNLRYLGLPFTTFEDAALQGESSVDAKLYFCKGGGGSNLRFFDMRAAIWLEKLAVMCILSTGVPFRMKPDDKDPKKEPVFVPTFFKLFPGEEQLATEFNKKAETSPAV